MGLLSLAQAAGLAIAQRPAAWPAPAHLEQSAWAQVQATRRRRETALGRVPRDRAAPPHARRASARQEQQTPDRARGCTRIPRHPGPDQRSAPALAWALRLPAPLR